MTGRSLPQLLKANGYATGLIGKWHLGGTPEVSANAHGFEYFFGFLAENIDHYRHDRGPNQPDLWENDKPIRQEGYMTDLITERSVQFIERNAGRPFFIDVAYNAPHWPYQPPGKPSAARENGRHLMPHDEETGTRADYVAMVERVDHGVGEILRTLDRLSLSKNTIVIFTNDNGGEWLSSNAPLFSRKLTVWGRGNPGSCTHSLAGDAFRLAGFHVRSGSRWDTTASILAATNTPVPPNVASGHESLADPGRPPAGVRTHVALAIGE